MDIKYNQAGFVPVIVLLLVGLIGGSVIIITKNIPFNKQPTELSAQVSPSPSSSLSPTASPVASIKPSSKPSPAPSTSSAPTPPPTNTPAPATSTTSSTSMPSPTPSPSPAPSSSPSPSPSPARKTYTWNGTNVNATVSCYIGETTFDVSISGDVPSPTGDNGIWTTLTGDGKTIITSYQGQASTPHIAMSYNDQVGPIRSGGPTTLRASNTTTYGYELQVYYAPYVDGMPSLANSIGNVSFAIDCSK